MALIAVNNLLWLVMGHRAPVIRPEDLATDWTFTITDTISGAVMDFSPVTILNVIRHYFVAIDSRYSVDRSYTVRIFNNVPVQVDSGEFQVVRGIWDLLTTTLLDGINDQLRLALGLAGMNIKRIVMAESVITGAPTHVDIELYNDAALNDLLATYTLKRRFNSVGLTVGEVMYQTGGSTSTGTGTGTGSATATGTGTGVAP